MRGTGGSVGGGDGRRGGKDLTVKSGGRRGREGKKKVVGP